MMRLSQHFALAEFLADDDPVGPSTKYIANLKRVADGLEFVRVAEGRPLRITPHGGFRSPSLNRRIGGAPLSKHRLGQAADVTAGDGLDFDEQIQFAAYASRAKDAQGRFYFGGIGIYPKNGFCHVDTRPRLFGRVTFWVRDPITKKYRRPTRGETALLRKAGAIGL